MSDKPRVRFAPSPTGYLHVGGARTALFNWLFARQQGGTFVLRIEDTDRQRSSDEMSAAILEGMKWLGLDWDEGPYHQADGFERHRADVQRLLDAGRAYRCFCPTDVQQTRRGADGEDDPSQHFRYDRRCARISPEEASRRAETGEPYAIRFYVPEGVTEWEDLVHGPTTFRNEDIEDFVILRSDGTPTYNLAVTSDDREMRITHVLRGDDHITNTPKQILLYQALSAETPKFAHLPMILGPDGRRLSKRHGAASVGEYREQGILPQALVNFLALLGWNPGDEQEIMLEPELIARFSIERIGKKSSIFDPEKLEWMNGQHLMRMSGHDLVPLVSPYLIERGLVTDEDVADREDWFAELIDLLKSRGRTLVAIAEQMVPFVATTLEYNEESVAKHWKDPDSVLDTLTRVREAFDELDDWSPAPIEAALRQTAESAGLSFGKLVHPLRVALMGSHASPGIDKVVWLLGKETTLSRIDTACVYVSRSGRPSRTVDTADVQT